MNRSSLHAGPRHTPPPETGWSRYRGRSSAALAWSVLFFGAALALLLLREQPFFQNLIGQAGSLLALAADYLWSAPTALTLLILLPLLLLRAYRRGDTARLYTCARWTLLILVFLFSIVPLRWAQLSFIRSPDSFLEYSPVDALLLLLSTLGALCYCRYCFQEIPSGMMRVAAKLQSFLFRCKEAHVIGLLLLLCLCMTVLIARTVLDGIPHVCDSIAQLFQAKIFMTGHLFLPSPAHKDFFNYLHVINDGRWYSQYPPGHALLLLLGLRCGAPWLIGPLAGTGSLALFYLLVKNTYQDRATTWLASLLLLASPFFLFMSASHMNHTSALLFLLLFLYFLQRSLASRLPAQALIAGLALGYAMTIRPLDAFAISLPFIAHLMARAINRKVPPGHVAAFLSGLLAMVLLLLLYNQCTNGNPLVFGYAKKYATMGFLGSAQGGPPHTLKGGIINTSNNLIGLNHYLFEWPLPSLLLIFILAYMVLFSSFRLITWDYLGLAASALLAGGYFFYYHQDLIFGPRFYYCLIPFLIMLSARCLVALPRWLEEKGFGKGRATAALYLALAVCIIYSVAWSVPGLVHRYSRDYWWVTDKVRAAVRQQGIANAVVFMDCWHPPDTPEPRLIYYGSGFQFNSPDLNDGVVYALDLKERNVELMQAYPGRRFYRCNFFWDRSGEAW